MNARTHLDRRALLGGALGAFAWLATGCDGRSSLSTLPAHGEQDFGGLTMGTSYTVKIADARLDPTQLDAARTAVRAALAEVVSSMSHYDASSELSRLNRQALGQPLQVSAALSQVIESALSVHRASAGAFDITLGETVNAWGFGPAQAAQRIPDSDRLRALQRPVGEDALQFDSISGMVTRTAPVSLNLSGIAKGFGVDRAALALDGLDIGNYMIEVGGEIRTQGRNAQGRAWQLAIERPDVLPQRALHVLPLQGKSLATSGDYRNYFMHQGRRYSHEIDPRSATPVQHALASVSVVADNCMQADAWSTALFVLGPERGLAAAQQQAMAAHFIVRRGDGGFDELQTPAFAALGGKRLA